MRRCRVCWDFLPRGSGDTCQACRLSALKVVAVTLGAGLALALLFLATG